MTCEEYLGRHGNGKGVIGITVEVVFMNAYSVDSSFTPPAMWLEAANRYFL